MYHMLPSCTVVLYFAAYDEATMQVLDHNGAHTEAAGYDLRKTHKVFRCSSIAAWLNVTATELE